MTDLAIRTEGLSKRYRIGARAERYRTLRDTLAGAGRALSQRFRRDENTPANTMWALRDVDFQVKPGEVVGIIGRNGAGKSTLLKVLSRITEPTSGFAEVRGRVGSLLEVGTGFHPELTGRENIYLNGAILGMKRGEIDRKFDEIVAFAEVEKFIDTPVKHYSSGMYLRLAFGVAAHLEPEILLVDEVLAVGDMEFQKKCFGKIGQVGREGRTVVLVSHNLSAIHALCSNCLVLSAGTVLFLGPVPEGIALYTGSTNSAREQAKTGEQRVGQVVMTSPTDYSWDSSRPLAAEWTATLPGESRSCLVFCDLTDDSGRRLVYEKVTLRRISDEQVVWRIRITFPALWLKSGNYTLQLRLFPNGIGKDLGFHSDPALMTIVGAPVSLTQAILAPRLSWELPDGGGRTDG